MASSEDGARAPLHIGPPPLLANQDLCRRLGRDDEAHQVSRTRASNSTPLIKRRNPRPSCAIAAANSARTHEHQLACFLALCQRESIVMAAGAEDRGGEASVTANDVLSVLLPERLVTRPFLFLVLEAERPLSGGSRFGLAGTDEVLIGRGP